MANSYDELMQDVYDSWPGVRYQTKKDEGANALLARERSRNKSLCC
jgi:hypothetical protein